jgi:hypothetical protein
LSKVLDSRSLSGRHIWTHVFREVELHPILKNGHVFYDRTHSKQDYPYRPIEGLYVHPQSGKLCWSSYTQPKYVRSADPNLKKLDDLHELVRLDGIWYLTTYHIVRKVVIRYSACTVCKATRPMPWPSYFYSPTSHKLIIASHDWIGRMTKEETSERKLLSKHQLSRKELLQHGKTNSPLPVVPPSRRLLRKINA